MADVNVPAYRFELDRTKVFQNFCHRWRFLASWISANIISTFTILSLPLSTFSKNQIQHTAGVRSIPQAINNAIK